MRKTKESASTDLPDAIGDRGANPKLLDLRARLQALQDRHITETRTREAVLERVSRLSKNSSLVMLAEALRSNPTASGLDAKSAQEELSHVDRLLEGIQLAIQHTERDLLQAQSELDAADCKKVAVWHRRNVRESINRMLELQRSVAAQQDLIQQLSARGVERTGFLQLHYPVEFAEGLADSNSYLSAFFRESVQLGFMTEAERVGLLQGRITVLDVDI